MCWSQQVALAFAVIQTAVLLFLVARNSHFDRHNAVFHLPLLLQEAVQALLWPHVDHTRDLAKGWHDPGLHTCSASNTRYSFLIAVVVAAVPLHCFFCAAAGVREHNAILQSTDEPPPTWRRYVGLLPFDRAFFVRKASAFVGMYLTILAALGWSHFRPEDTACAWCSARCTTKGPWGHQIWSMMVYRHRVDEFIMAAVYFGSAGMFSRLVRPSLTIFALGGPLATCFVVFYLVAGPEAGSVWCWSTFTLCAVYLVEPRLIDRFGVVSDALINPSDEANELRASRRASGPAGSLCFTLMWAHFGQPDFTSAVNGRCEARDANKLPWRDPIEVAQELGAYNVAGSWTPAEAARAETFTPLPQNARLGLLTFLLSQLTNGFAFAWRLLPVS